MTNNRDEPYDNFERYLMKEIELAGYKHLDRKHTLEKVLEEYRKFKNREKEGVAYDTD